MGSAADWLVQWWPIIFPSIPDELRQPTHEHLPADTSDLNQPLTTPQASLDLWWNWWQPEFFPSDRCPTDSGIEIFPFPGADPVFDPGIVDPFPEPLDPPIMMSADGTLTSEELAELQRIADKYNTEIHVVGSRAAGEGKDIDTNLPVGKGDGFRSDIDIRIDGQVNIDTGGYLADEILDIGGGGVTQIYDEWLPLRPSYEPVIIITPQ